MQLEASLFKCLLLFTWSPGLFWHSVFPLPGETSPESLSLVSGIYTFVQNSFSDCLPTILLFYPETIFF